MHRVRGGKKIRMDDIPMDIGYQYEGNFPEEMEEVGFGPGPSAQRMTRLRARGGVPSKPPIIDEEDEDFFGGRKRKNARKPLEPRERPIPVPRAPREPKAPKEPRIQHEEHTGDKLAVREREITTDESSLFYTLRYSKSTITVIVDEWIENYKIERENALIALMQFFINASGCKGRITPEMQSNMEHTSIIRKMTEEFDEESGEYPLIMTGQQWKKFKVNFCDYVQTLVKQCQYSIIYDQVCFFLVFKNFN